LRGHLVQEFIYDKLNASAHSLDRTGRKCLVHKAAKAGVIGGIEKEYHLTEGCEDWAQRLHPHVREHFERWHPVRQEPFVSEHCGHVVVPGRYPPTNVWLMAHLVILTQLGIERVGVVEYLRVEEDTSFFRLHLVS
jgi:hypothetical protein